MGSPLVFNDPAVKPESIDAPAPSDPRTAASVKDPMQGLLDYCQWLYQQLVAGQSVAWSMPLTLAGYQRMVFSGGPVDDLPVALAATGHVNGAAAKLFIPAGSCSSNDALHLPDDLHLDGDAFDYLRDYTITVEYEGDQVQASGRALPARDASALSLVSATVSYGTEDTLVLVFDAPTFIPPGALSGLTLDFSVGTARTVSAIASGNGSATIALTLSGAIATSDVFTLSIAAETVAKLNGPYLPELVDEPVSNETGEPVFPDTFFFYRGDDLGADGSSISSWPDKSGNGYTLVQPTAGEQPVVDVVAAINNQKAAVFDGTNDSVYHVSPGLSVADVTDFTILLVYKHDGTSADIPISIATSAGTEFSFANIYRESGTLGGYVADNAAPASVADSSTAWRVLMLIHEGASRSLYLNGALAGSNNTAKDPGAARFVRLGRGYENGYGPLAGAIAEVRLVGRKLTAGERAVYATYTNVRYGL